MFNFELDHVFTFLIFEYAVWILYFDSPEPDNIKFYIFRRSKVYNTFIINKIHYLKREHYIFYWLFKWPLERFLKYVEDQPQWFDLVFIEHLLFVLLIACICLFLPNHISVWYVCEIIKILLLTIFLWHTWTIYFKYKF